MAGKTYPLELLIGALDRTAAPLIAFNKRLEALNEPVRRLQRSFATLQRESGLLRMQRSFKEVGTAGENLFVSMSRAGRQLLWIGAAATGAAYGLGRFIGSAAKTAETIKELSDQTGMSIEGLQTLGYAGEQVGLSKEGFSESVARFSKNLGQAKAGTGALYEMLKRIDPHFLRLIVRAKGTDDAFRMMLGRIGRIADSSAGLALTTSAFGRSAGMMANLARLSSSELGLLEDRMRSIGTISAQDANNADAMSDAWSTFTLTLRNMGVALAAPIFPVLTDQIKGLTDWLVANRAKVKEWADEFADKLPARLEVFLNLTKGLWDAMKPLGSVLKWVSENTWVLSAALGVLSAGIFGPVILNAAKFGISILNAGMSVARFAAGPLALLTRGVLSLGAGLMSTPLGWFLAGLAGIAYASYRVWKDWKLVSSFFTDMWKEWSDWIDRITVGLGGLISKVPILGRFATSGDSMFAAPIGARTFVPDSPRAAGADSRVTVKFENTPRGARVEQPRAQKGVDLDVGYQFAWEMP